MRFDRHPISDEMLPFSELTFSTRHSRSVQVVMTSHGISPVRELFEITKNLIFFRPDRAARGRPPRRRLLEKCKKDEGWEFRDDAVEREGEVGDRWQRCEFFVVRRLQVIHTEVDMAYLFEFAKLIWDCIGDRVVIETEVKEL
ncbi:hypothetical protein QJS10_CPB18g01937 [Acorus calamus]|uniref:Uncharacterized protein n=1 Tax=Acorus calamus TaxID=4465 RepID=A0AAV9CMG7_ACOCL|nr:hypothetical protein QJS10_CPB18g01937 [Acorus calamus]